jgi:hypothetical protein
LHLNLVMKNCLLKKEKMLFRYFGSIFLPCRLRECRNCSRINSDEAFSAQLFISEEISISSWSLLI